MQKSGAFHCTRSVRMRNSFNTGQLAVQSHTAQLMRCRTRKKIDIDPTL